MSKKTAIVIESDILKYLEDKPLTITDLKFKLGSNWTTVEKFLQKLKDEKKVKEIISTDKKKMYQLSYPETYFEIPISTEEKKKFNALYNLILEQYKEHKKIPTKTEFAKVAVDVIKDSSELKDLPTIWYLYGIIPLMAAEPDKEYFKEIHFDHEIQIKNSIVKSIEDKKGKSSITIQREQHEKYGDLFYVHCDNFIDNTKDKWNKEKILENLNNIYINCPIDEEFHVFDYFDKFNSTIRKLFYLENLKEESYRRDVIITFDSLWKYFATYSAYKSIKKLNRFKDQSEILRFYIGNMIESREISLKESLSNIYSIYLNSLGESVNLETSKEINEIRNILEDLY